MLKFVAAIAAAVCASAAFAHTATPAPSGLQLTPVQYVVPSDRYHRHDNYRLERERAYRHWNHVRYDRWARVRHERYAHDWRRHERYVRLEHRHHYRRYVG